jgi:hypothetical protein
VSGRVGPGWAEGFACDMANTCLTRRVRGLSTRTRGVSGCDIYHDLYWAILGNGVSRSLNSVVTKLGSVQPPGLG